MDGFESKARDRMRDLFLKLRKFRPNDGFQARIVTRHCRPSCSVGMGAYSMEVTAPVHALCSSEASIPMTVIGTLDRNDSVHRSASSLLT
jgi:hypothetical protein